MSKKDKTPKTPKQDRHTEPRLPHNNHPGRSEAPASPAHEASEAVERMRYDPDDPRPRDPATTRTDSGPMDASGKLNRHIATGQFVEGASVPEQPAGHEVVRIDLNDPAAQAALTHPRPGGQNAPNGLPAGAIGPTVNALDVDDVGRLSS